MTVSCKRDGRGDDATVGSSEFNLFTRQPINLSYISILRSRWQTKLLIILSVSSTRRFHHSSDELRGGSRVTRNHEIKLMLCLLARKIISSHEKICIKYTLYYLHRAIIIDSAKIKYRGCQRILLVK